MAGRFTKNEWDKIEKELDGNPTRYGMPEGGREKSLVLGSFNIRKLGEAQRREREIDFMARFCAACDLVAIQEIQDNLDGLRQLKKCTEKRSSKEYGLVLSDITGEVPGEEGMAERLAFMYRRERIRRLELASDLTFDRTAVLRRLAKNKEAWLAAIYTYKWQLKEFCEKRVKNKPKLEPLAFLTFVRTPYVVAFEAPAANDAPPLTFTAVNAHLVYGTMREREEEFRALIEWLINRLKSADRILTPNFILIGDLNLNFDNPKRIVTALTPKSASSTRKPSVMQTRAASISRSWTSIPSARKSCARTLGPAKLSTTSLFSTTPLRKDCRTINGELKSKTAIWTASISAFLILSTCSRGR